MVALSAQEIKKRISIEEMIAHYGASVNANGVGRCLFPERHHRGDRHPSMHVKHDRLKCWSQGCFGEKGADIFGLVAVMQNLPGFAQQRDRVLAIARLEDNGTEPRCIQPTPRPRRLDWRQTAADLQDHALSLRLRANSVLEAAKGLDISQWSEADLDVAITSIGYIYEDLKWTEALEAVAFDLRVRGLEQERVAYAA